MSPKKKNTPDETFEEKIIDRPLSKAIHDYMMPYAEYIILDRALPRVEDGLKPVQRRILYAMHELNMKPDGPYKKSARVVGDCLGKYHPHGDSSIYQAMVNMAQDFNMRNTLVNGHGNFGSVDGDGAAAMRYTEVKLEPLACELLRDLDKETVKWGKNFDDSLLEPEVLPGRFPNLLVNGSMGIAIGLATKIPPHNLTEVIDGVIATIDNPKITLPDLLQIIKGPDFPTGGFVIPGDSFEEIYTTGRGRIIMRSRVEIETADNDKQAIVITEIPYGVNKAELQKKILNLREANAAKKGEGDKSNGILNGIQEIVDESDRHGIRVVIRLKKGEDAAKILDYLYQKSDLQLNFNVNIVAIADGRPQQLGLQSLIGYYIKHQRDIIYKRSQFELNNAKKREHILDGFALILPAIDEVIALIKSSNSRSEARDKLRARFALSERQADAILDLKLVNLTKMEITKIEKELKELKTLIAQLEKILASKSAQLEVVRRELLEVRERYLSKRMSVVVSDIADIDYKPYQITSSNGKRGYVVLQADGKLKFVTPRQFLMGDREIPSHVKGTAKEICLLDKGEQIILFGSQGNCYRLNIDTIRESAWMEDGENLAQLFPEAPSDERCIGVLKLTDDVMQREIYAFTANGMVKKSLGREYSVNKDIYQGVVLKDGDEVIGIEIKNDAANIVFVASDGQCLNTDTEDYPVQGRKAGGVIGISLNTNARVVWAGQIEKEDDEIVGELLLITDGYAKRVIASSVETSKRARKGIKVIDAEGRKFLYAGGVTVPYKVALIESDGKVHIVDTEEILIDRNRLGKGKPLTVAAGCLYAEKHLSES